MSEEMKNEVINNENELEVLDPTEETENSENGSLGKLAVGALVVGVAAGALATFVHKNKDKIKERRIAKLEKEGYVVYKPVEDDIEDDFSEDEESVAEIED